MFLQFLTKEVVEINPSTLQCSLVSSEGPKSFTFDGVYDQNSTTEQIYTDFGYPLVEVSQLFVNPINR